jgi:alpha-soluble NSF attachment protein
MNKEEIGDSEKQAEVAAPEVAAPEVAAPQLSVHKVTAPVYVLKADKKLKSWFSNLFNPKETKYEEAAELYERGASLYKLAKEHVTAGDTYLKAAECYNNANDKMQAVSSIINAANCYRSCKNTSATTTLKAIKCYEEAYTISINEGKFLAAANYLKQIAEIYELDNMRKACDYYLRAMDMYESENDKTNKNKCLLKAAELLSHADIKNYSEAIKSYEKLVDSCIDNNLQRFKVKEYLFKAGLCWFLQEDLVGAIRALDNYDEKDCSFASSAEGKFLRKLVICLDQYDVTSFTDHIIEYDRIYPLDKWKTSVLLSVKQNIQKGIKSHEDLEHAETDEGTNTGAKEGAEAKEGPKAREGADEESLR